MDKYPQFLEGLFVISFPTSVRDLLICFMSYIAWLKVFRPGLTIQLINMEGQNSCSKKAAKLEVLVVVLNVCGGWRSQHLRGWAFNTRTPLSVERGGNILSVMNYRLPNHVTVKVWIFQNNTYSSKWLHAPNHTLFPNRFKHVKYAESNAACS